MAAKERTKENCRCFDAVRGCARGATAERSETGERTMIAPAGQSTARACLRSKLAALVVRRQAGARLRGCTPLRTPKRRSEGAGAKRKQYYFSFLTPPPLPPPLSREFPRTPALFNGCSVGVAYMPPATYRGHPPTAKGEGCRPPLPLSSATHLWHPVGAGHARPSTLPLPPMYLLPLRPASPPAPPELKHKKIAPIRLRLRMGAWGIGLCEEESCSRITVAAP